MYFFGGGVFGPFRTKRTEKKLGLVLYNKKYEYIPQIKKPQKFHSNMLINRREIQIFIDLEVTNKL